MLILTLSAHPLLLTNSYLDAIRPLITVMILILSSIIMFLQTHSISKGVVPFARAAVQEAAPVFQSTASKLSTEGKAKGNDLFAKGVDKACVVTDRIP